jgi:DNA-directed RNA polymerase specialized sigma24 family protein
MSDDDVALVAAVRDGSELAFNTLVDRHQQAVRMFLRRLLGNDADADDLAQETFLAAWTQARS